MRWFRRRPRFSKFDPSLLPTPEIAPVSVGVSEGLLLAEYASRMTLKNRIIIDAVAAGEHYEPERYTDDAREVLETLAQESTQAADRLAEERRAASAAYGKASHMHDYRSSDLDNLIHREEVASRLAATLRKRRDDPEYVARLVEEARAAAWDDVGRAVEDSLDRETFVVDDAYESERDQRVAALIAEDLAALAAARADDAEPGT